MYVIFRTLCMLLTAIILVVVSVATRKLHDAGCFPDLLGVFDEDTQPVVVAMTGRGVDNPAVDVSSEKIAHVREVNSQKREKGGAYSQAEMEKVK